MRWELSDEQQLLRESLRDWLADVAAPDTVRGWLDGGAAEPFDEAFVRAGWSGVGTPESLGGQGGDLLELALIAELLGRAVTPATSWLTGVLAVPALAGLPAELSSVLDDGEPLALAVPAGVIPSAPLDRAGGAATQQRPTVDGDRVSGHVGRVLGAGRAVRLIVPVVDDGTSRLVLVDASDERVTVTPRRLLDRSRSVADVALDAMPGELLDVDADAVLADVAQRGAVLVAADALGVLDRMLALAVEHSLQRHQFGVPIAKFQAVKHAAADLLVKVEAARSIVYFAAASVRDAHPEAALHAAAAKAQVTGDAARGADTALTMHGAIGYTWEYELQLLYKRAKLDAELFGSPARWNERIADLLALVAS